ncbi:MAG: mechanosensitive ion channel family protein [Verrucomicrobiota bacterium]
MSQRILSLLAVLGLFLAFGGVHAEEAAPEAVTASDPAIPTQQLALRLEPLTQAELAAEADAWHALLKSKAEEIAEVEIASIQEIPAAEKETLLKKLGTLEADKTALIERFEIVATAFELKGGDPADLRKYAAAVSGIDTNITDVGATTFMIAEWLKSEEGGIKWAILIAKFIGIMFAFWILARIVKRLVKKVLDRTAYMSDLLEDFIYKMVGRVIIVIGLIIALGTVGVNVGAALALIGGGAFILAFALQDTLGNFANGVMLLVYRPFDVGDAVEVGGVTGKVESVSLVNTTILTFDNKKVIVPNKSVWGQVITNITGMPTRRVDMTFGIGYDDDTDQARAILEKVVNEHELALKDPAPQVILTELADSSVNFACRPWAKTGDYWTVFTEVTDRVKKEFDAVGISIPYPQQDVHLHQVAAGDATKD